MIFKCFVILLGFTCWLIRHCSSAVASALPLLLRSAAWRCALHIQFQLVLCYLLFFPAAHHRFSLDGSCIARAASVVAQSLCATAAEGGRRFVEYWCSTQSPANIHLV
jgi:hypothetical protein